MKKIKKNLKNIENLNKLNMNIEDININEINVSSKLDDVITKAVNEGYTEVFNKNNNYGDKNMKNNRNFKKSAAAAALAVAIGATVFGTGLGDEVIANVKLAMFDIGNYLGVNKDLEDYKTVVNRTVSKNGITIQLNEVILDKDEIIVSTTVKSDEKLGENGSMNFSGDVYINGKRVSDAAGGSSKVIDEYTEETVLSYKLTEELPLGDLDIEIKYNEGYVFVGGESTKVRGPWKFEFRANGDTLSSNSNIIELNNSFELENGQKITLNEYRSNPVGDKIYYSIENKDKNNVFNVVLKGHDDLGNKVEFYSSYEELTAGLMKNQTEISEEATTLTLTPYAVAYPKESGKMSNDFKKAGEEFTIEIK